MPHKFALARKIVRPVRRFVASLFTRLRRRHIGAGISQADRESLVAAGLFDRNWYLKEYPDVGASGVDPLEHYLTRGAAEGRNPNQLFDTRWYLERNTDVRATGHNPVLHYLHHGAAEGRDPSREFSTRAYLRYHRDVAADNANPLGHYLKHGKAEGRRVSRASDDDKNIDDYVHEYQSRLAVSLGQRDRAYASIAAEPIAHDLDTVKPIAFYLPQMHPIPENDRAWGKGFTEWTNVAKAVPQFVGHYQPKLPGELGFYDLRVPEVLYRQIELAKIYGIHAFCFHYYWFNGRRLLEKPVDLFLADKRMDLNFCLCWANENWTRNWDGLEDEIIVAQRHSIEDHELVFADLLRYLKDDRYVRIRGCPVIVVYRPAIIGDVRDMIEIWRRKALEADLPGLFLVATNSFGFNSAKELGFDAMCDFPPHGLSIGCHDIEDTKLNSDYIGSVYNYEDFVTAALEKLRTTRPDVLRFPGVMTGWDNVARRPGAGNVFYGSTPLLFHKWLVAAANHVNRDPESEQRLIFINSWNEWAEGAYLEPDRRYGYAYLAAVRNVVERFNTDPERLRALAASYNAGRPERRTCDTAACVHIFYPSLTGEFAKALARARLSREMDVIVSIPQTWSDENFATMVEVIKPIRVVITENVGRDIWPFLQALRIGDRMGYKYGCKLHSKMSTHLTCGASWRRRLVDAVLDDSTIEELQGPFFRSQRTGLAAAKWSFHTLHDDDTVLHNLSNMTYVLSRLGFERPELEEFVAGSMFWFRFEAFKRLANSGIDASWFDQELGQIDGTMAHAFERIFCAYVSAAGWSVIKFDGQDPAGHEK